jgi:hypothetical protein
VVAGLALGLSVVALLTHGPDAGAAKKISKIGSKQIANNSIKGVDIKNRSLGADDLPIYITNSGLQSLPGGGTTSTVTAQCNPGDAPLGGGGGLVNAPEGAVPTSSILHESDSQGLFEWIVTASNYSATPTQMQATIICLNQ